MRRKGLALIVSLILSATAVLTGCGSSQNPESVQNTISQSPASEDGSIEEGDTETPKGDVTLPLTEEKTTLRIWAKNDTIMTNLCDGDYNNLPIFQELENRTNVHIDWVIPTGTDMGREAFNLMISSGELADIIFQLPGVLEYPDGFDAAVDDGYYLDLTELIDQYALHYKAAIENGNETVKRNTTTDSGRKVMFLSIMKEPQPVANGWMVRQDWMESMGLDVPVTYGDWEKMLTAFKEQKGCSAALSMVPDGVWSLGTGMGAYGEYYQIDGKVYYGMYDNPEETKEYLTLMNDWYKKGLIDPNFTSNDYNSMTSLITTGKTAAIETWYTGPSGQFKPSMDEDVEFMAVARPRKTAGQEMHVNNGTQYTGGGFVISADCENPELAVKWLDYLYSEEGYLLANFGLEGETYVMGDDGMPEFTEVMNNNADGMSIDETMRYYTWAPGFGGSLTEYRRETQSLPEHDVAFMEVWNSWDNSYVFPNEVTLNTEENAEYSKLYSDIETYVDENILNFVTGVKSVDEYDAFVTQLKDMGIERCIEIKQGGLDRYLAR